MNKSRKRLTIICALILALCLNFAGCGNKGNTILAEVTAAPTENAEGEAVVLSYTARTLAEAMDLRMALDINGVYEAGGEIYVLTTDYDVFDESGGFIGALYHVNSEGESEQICYNESENTETCAICAHDDVIWLVQEVLPDKDRDEYELRRYENGSLTSIAALDLGENTEPFSICIAGGRVYIGTQMEGRIGQKLHTYSLTGEKENEQSIGVRFELASDGETLYIGTHGKDSSDLTVNEYDAESGMLRELTKLSESYLLSCSGTMLYIGGADSAFEYDLTTGEIKHILNWTSSGLKSRPSTFTRREDGSILADDSDRARLLTPYVGAEKKQIKLATYSPDGSAYSEEILDFNDISTEYEIVIQNYADYPNPVQALAADMAAGNIPDLIDIVDFSKEMLHSGLLVDLMTYLENDEEIGVDDLMEAPLRNMLTENGELFAITPKYGIASSLRCLKDSVEVTEFTTVTDALERLGSAEEAFGTSLGLGVTRENFLSMAFGCEDAGKYSQEDITAILEYAITLQEEYEYSEEGFFEELENIANRKIKFCESGYIDALYCFWYYTDYCPLTVTTAYGSPFREGTGVASVSSYLAIPINAENPDGAWEFIKTLLREEEWGFPLLKSTHEKWLAKSVEKLYDNIRYFAPEKDEEWVSETAAACVEECEKAINGLNGLSITQFWSEPIMDIVLDDAAYYFAGTKTAEDCAKIIKSRIDLYLAEQYG